MPVMVSFVHVNSMTYEIHHRLVHYQTHLQKSHYSFNKCLIYPFLLSYSMLIIPPCGSAHSVGYTTRSTLGLLHNIGVK